MRTRRPWALLQLTTRDVVGEERALCGLGPGQRRKHNVALGPFQRRSRQDSSCSMEAGLGPFIIIEEDWWALGQMMVAVDLTALFVVKGIVRRRASHKGRRPTCESYTHVSCEFLGQQDADTWRSPWWVYKLGTLPLIFTHWSRF